MSAHPSDLVWSRHLGGTLGVLERWRLRRHLAGCEACRAQEKELFAQKAGFDAAPERAVDLALLASGLPRVASLRPRRSRLEWAVGFASAAAAAALVLMVARPVPSGDLTAKGPSAFAMYLKRGDSVVPLGKDCQPGDRVRGKLSSEKPFVLIVEVDATRRPHVLHPLNGKMSAMNPRGPWETPGSWIIDATPGEERFIAVFTREPVDIAVVGPSLVARADVPGAEVLEQRCLKGSR
jgi:hypothetical protein